VAVFCFVFANTFLAVEPGPNSETKEKVEGIRSSGGAIKIEKKTAVPPEALKKDAPAEMTPVAPVEVKTDTKETKETTTTTTNSNEGSHLFGVHASVGLPHPVNFGLNYMHSSRIFSSEISTGSYSLKVSGVDVKLENLELALRWHPFAGAFFVGGLLGNQKITAVKTELVTDGIVSANVTGTAEVKSNYLTPHLGWFWGMDDGGFFVSFDIGLQTPSGVSTTFSSDVPAALQSHADYVQLEADVKDEGNKVGNMSLPYMTLLKLGWMF
jgi:hypothetical protein